MLSPRLLLVALLAVLSLVLAACGSEESGGAAATADDATQSGGMVAETAALKHIHGLGVNPADKRLYIATHNGLFSVADGQMTPEKVGESTQDLMGFSVIGPDRFIASGHPSLDQDLPPQIGLIESRDGGKTWENVSLLGEADFHALESSGQRVYGFDGVTGKLMVSSDGGRNWKSQEPPAGVFGLAIDPTDADRVIASTEQGVFVSADAGGEWKALRSDLGGLLAWPERDRLYLVDGDGQVLLSRDGGQSWQAQGSIGGQPAALMADGGDLYAALADGTVKRSTDGGQNWELRAQP
jgi:hypothetical protein